MPYFDEVPDGWAGVPAALLSDPDVTAGEFLVAMALSVDDDMRPVHVIAGLPGPTEVIEACEGLERKGWATRDEHGSYVVNTKKGF